MWAGSLVPPAVCGLDLGVAGSLVPTATLGLAFLWLTSVFGFWFAGSGAGLAGAGSLVPPDSSGLDLGDATFGLDFGLAGSCVPPAN